MLLIVFFGLAAEWVLSRLSESGNKSGARLVPWHQPKNGRHDSKKHDTWQKGVVLIVIILNVVAPPYKGVLSSNKVNIQYFDGIFPSCFGILDC